MSVLVTDGNQRSTLAVVRAFGREGIPVTVGEATERSLAGTSRYCTRSVTYPAADRDEAAFRAFLGAEISRGRYRMLLPMTDVTTQIAASLRSELPPTVCVPIPGSAQVAQVQDKRRVLEVARQLGIPCPETWTPPPDEIEALAARLPYPVVIKPRFSRFRSPTGWHTGGVTFAASGTELVAHFREVHQQIPEPLIQEKIEGEGRGVFLLLWGGEVKAALCHRRLREKPPWGGVSVYRESLPLDQELVSQSAALLRALDWQGVAMVEYKLDRRDEVAKLMEVNGRFWGSLQLALDAGLNFPAMMYRLAVEQDVPPALVYSPGVRSRWLLGDLDHLLTRLRHSTGPDGAPLGGSRVRTLLDFLRFWEPRMRYEVWRLDDPRPGWFECRAYVRELFKASS